MKRSTILVVTFLMLLATIGTVSAKPFDVRLVTNKVCLSGQQALFVSAFVTSNKSLVENRVAEKQSLGNSSKSMPALEAGACALSQTSELLSEHQGTLSALYATSIHAVVAYEEAQATSPAVTTGGKQTQTIVYGYGPNYVIVVTSLLPKAAGQTIPLSCKEIAYFRVQPSSGQVLPYDGCVEAHVRTLPMFSELP